MGVISSLSPRALRRVIAGAIAMTLLGVFVAPVQAQVESTCQPGHVHEGPLTLELHVSGVLWRAPGGQIVFNESRCGFASSIEITGTEDADALEILLMNDGFSDVPMTIDMGAGDDLVALHGTREPDFVSGVQSEAGIELAFAPFGNFDTNISGLEELHAYGQPFRCLSEPCEGEHPDDDMFLFGDGGGFLNPGSLTIPVELAGGDGSDTLYGGSANDVVTGNDGRDSLYGGDGADTLHGGNASSPTPNSEASGGHDRLWGQAGDDALFGDNGADVLWGDDGDDVLSGEGAKDVLLGGPDHDHLYGGSDDDTLRGWTGGDELYGAAGFDRLFGERGRDYLVGNDGRDLLRGGFGADQLWGGNPSVIEGPESSTAHRIDYMFGGTADDQLFGGDGADRLYGRSGNDAIMGENGHDFAYGGSGRDRLFGGNNGDYLTGEEGRDELYGESGSDRLFGRFGRDYLVGNDGRDRLAGGVGADTLWGGNPSATSDHESAPDTNANDILNGGNGADNLFGGDGGDRLLGAEGDDAIAGDNGHDFANGGLGSDEIYGGVGDDTLLGAFNLHIGIILSSPSFPTFEELDVGADSIYGDVGSDHIEGGPFDDVLVGNDGDDLIYGRDGSDTVYGDNNSGPDDLTRSNSDYLAAGDGDDFVAAGSGDDTVFEGAEPNGADDIDGGSGGELLGDLIDYTHRSDEVLISQNGDADDGSPDEDDNVGGFELLGLAVDADDDGTYDYLDPCPLDRTDECPRDSAGAELPPNGSISTGSDATSDNPTTTTITAPNGGTVTIAETEVTEEAPSGWSFLGEQVNITAPPATSPDQPLVIQFRLDASVIPTGMTIDSLAVFRNEAEAAATCPELALATTADYPCIASRTVETDGDFTFVVRTMTASAWNFGQQAPQQAPPSSGGGGGGTARHELTVEKVGTGRGTVESSPAGISCGKTCSALFPAGATVRLTASPADDSLFVEWSGPCSGSGTCVVTMTQSRLVGANFRLQDQVADEITARSTLTIGYRDATDTLRADLSSSRQECETHRKVTFKKRSDGADRVLARRWTYAGGVARLRGISDPHGVYYATVQKLETRPDGSTATLTCGPDTSNLLRLGGPR